MNNLLILLIVVWVVCAHHAYVRKSIEALGLAAVVTVLAGLGHVIIVSP